MSTPHLDGPRIRHTVVFRLQHAAGSAAEQRFLADAARILPAIPGVERFEALRQVSPKNAFTFGFSERIRPWTRWRQRSRTRRRSATWR